MVGVNGLDQAGAIQQVIKGDKVDSLTMLITGLAEY